MRNFRDHPLRAICLLLTFCLTTLSSVTKAEAYGSGWYGELQFGFGHEDNISRSFLDIDEVSDDTARLSVGGGYSQKVGTSAQLVFYGYIAATVHDEYDDLDNFATTVGATYTYQARPSFDAPWYVADISATNLKYENSDGREGVLFRGDLNVNKRLGTRTTGRFGYRYHDLVFLSKTSAEEDRDAAFDTATHEAYLGLDYQLLDSIYLYGEYAFKRGGAWSNVSFDAGIVQYDAETIDTVFDDCEGNPRCQPRYAGRIENDIHVLNLGVVFPIRTANIDVSAVYVDAAGDNGLDYKDWLVSVGMIWNF